MRGKKYTLRIPGVTAVQWFKLGDHPKVVGAGPRRGKNNGRILTTEDGWKMVRPGFYVVTQKRAGWFSKVTVMYPDEFEKLYKLEADE